MKSKKYFPMSRLVVKKKFDVLTYVDYLPYLRFLFIHFQSSNRDNNVLANACRRLKNKSEAGYRGLLRLLNKCGYINVSAF